MHRFGKHAWLGLTRPQDLKERIIPRAVDFMTGKALRYEQDLDDLDSDEDEDFECVAKSLSDSPIRSEPARSDDDDDDSEDDAGLRVHGARRAAQPPALGVTPASSTDPQEVRRPLGSASSTDRIQCKQQ